MTAWLIARVKWKRWANDRESYALDPRLWKSVLRQLLKEEGDAFIRMFDPDWVG